jgi:hypothetical protein
MPIESQRLRAFAAHKLAVLRRPLPKEIRAAGRENQIDLPACDLWFGVASLEEQPGGDSIGHSLWMGPFSPAASARRPMT